jgi:hypothetical protein
MEKAYKEKRAETRHFLLKWSVRLAVLYASTDRLDAPGNLIHNSFVALSVVPSKDIFKFKINSPILISFTHVSLKIVGSRPDEVNEFFSIYVIPPVELGPGIYSASKRSEYRIRKIMFLGSRTRSMHRFHSLTAICEPNVYTM